VPQNPLDDLGLLDQRQEAEAPAAASAGPHVDAEGPLHQRRP